MQAKYLIILLLVSCSKVQSTEPTTATVTTAATVSPDTSVVTSTPDILAESSASQPKPVFKEICLDVQDKAGNKIINPVTKTPKQECTQVRVRRKYDGTRVPDIAK